MNELLKRYINRECTITTRNDEYDGVLTEVGEGYVLISDGMSDCILNIAHIESVSFDTGS